jgi:hypothetical protein
VDFNGDGKVDLITANYNDNTISVLANLGNGSFAPAVSVPVGFEPDALVAADVNGDGKVDIICANYGASTVSVLMNNGSGGFGSNATYTVGSGPMSVVAGDVNGDGKVDLITANSGTNTLSVLTNDGRGGFVLAASPGTGNNPRTAVAADLNGDGKLDLVSGNFLDNTLTVLMNTPLFNGYLSGNGAGLTSLTASQLTGTVPASALNGANGGGLTNLNGANIVGTLGAAQLPASVVTNGSSGVTINGTFNGNGSGLTNLNASNLTSGTVADARLSANVALRANGNVFSGSNYFTGGSLSLGNPEPIWANSSNGTSEVFLWPRYTDDATYLDIGSTGFYIRDHTGAANLLTLQPNGNLSMEPVLGDRLALFPGGGTSSYGFGISNLTLQVHTDTSLADIVFGYGSCSNLTETMRIKGNGKVGIGTPTPSRMLQLGGPTNTEAMIRLTSTAADNSGARTWEIGVPKNDTNYSGKYYSFVIDDTSLGTDPEFLIQYNTGNVGIGTNNPTSKLTVAGNIYATGTITPNSDRNLKTDFAEVDVKTVLDKVANLPIQQWRFLAEPEGVKHFGPMAQDFRAAFGLGERPTAIATVDADGVALAAIQGLNQKVEGRSEKFEVRSKESESRIQRLEAENAELKARLERLEQLLNR